MCKESCEKYQDYVALYISDLGHDILYKENLFKIPRLIKVRKTFKSVGEFSTFNKLKGQYASIRVHYDRYGNILKIRSSYVR